MSKAIEFDFKVIWVQNYISDSTIKEAFHFCTSKSDLCNAYYNLGKLICFKFKYIIFYFQLLKKHKKLSDISTDEIQVQSSIDQKCWGSIFKNDQSSTLDKKDLFLLSSELK